MPGKPQSQSLAVLIDAENTSARHAHAIFVEIVKLGETNVRRIYGDFPVHALPAGTGRYGRSRSCSISSAATQRARMPPTSRL